MKYASGVITGVLGTVLVGGTGWWLVAAKPGDGGKTSPPPIPATVTKGFKEDQAATITLTAEAEARLAIKTGTIERKPMKRVRSFGGEVLVLPGHSVIVSAPLAGTLKPIAGMNPVAGLAVVANKPVFQLVPLLDPGARANLAASSVDAEGQINNAGELLKAANVALDRAKNVLKGGAGSQKSVDDAQAAAEQAKQTLEAAKARSELFKKVVGNIETGTTTAIPIDAPQTGIIRVVSALPGQTVPAGAALFEVIDINRVWVRVPVYVGDLSEIDTAAEARIGVLTGRPGDVSRPAKMIAAPPAANPIPGTADLIYELDNRETHYRPGERVGATLLLNDPAESLVVPWSAVVFDIHGGAWVYERTGERVYSRKRVVVRHVTGDTAVLDSGPATGTTIVTVGAAELFGTDAGFSK